MTRSVRTVVLAVVALLGLLVVGVVAPAGASTRTAVAAPCVYVRACTPTLSVVSPTTAAGSTQTVVGTGFLPGDRVTVTITLADGSTIVLTAVADANGSFTLTFTVPDDLGLATLVAVGERSGTASTTMTVVSGGIAGGGGPTVTDGGGTTGAAAAAAGSGSSDGGGLAFTGVAVAATGGLALLLVLTGGVLLVLGRRPRRHASGEY